MIRKAFPNLFFSWISRYYPVDEMFEEYEVDEKEFVSEIEYALDEIGF